MYNVVFAYTAETGGYEGVMTSTGFESKVSFDQWFTPELQKTYRVVAEGISAEEAENITISTPVKCYIAAAFEEATDQETGRVNQQVFNLHMDNALLTKILKNPNDPDIQPEALLLYAFEIILERAEKRMLQEFADAGKSLDPIADRITQDMLPG